MSRLGERIIASAQQQVGAPFEHHFKPQNLCDGGRVTVDACMERGMDPESGFDCSGLTIASFAIVMGLATADWPQDLRHTKQLEAFAVAVPAEPGDVCLYYSANGRTHAGIAVTATTAIHASGVTKRVEQGEVTDMYGDFVVIKSISAAALRQLVLNRE
ncbi:MAG TPA: NlpC/P60 family protein [Candidatus Saccharimonadales bacterium]|nr:NlpC/P60 family protein [Candidatus Saccharimonadales bacterium]